MVAKHWSADQKIRIVMESITTKIDVPQLCTKHNLSPNTFYPWKEKFFEGGKAALNGADGNAAKSHQKEIDNLKQIIAELTIANEAFKKTLEGRSR